MERLVISQPPKFLAIFASTFLVSLSISCCFASPWILSEGYAVDDSHKNGNLIYSKSEVKDVACNTDYDCWLEANSYCHPTIKVCITCSVGQYWDGFSCQSCKLGETWDGISKTCKDVDDGIKIALGVIIALAVGIPLIIIIGIIACCFCCAGCAGHACRERRKKKNQHKQQTVMGGNNSAYGQYNQPSQYGNPPQNYGQFAIPHAKARGYANNNNNAYYGNDGSRGPRQY